MTNFFYETDDETGIYLEDDSTFEAPEIPPKIAVTDIEEHDTSVPMEDAIVDTIPFQEDNSILKIPFQDGNDMVKNPVQEEKSTAKKEAIDSNTETMMKISLMIKKWWVCWFVSFVVTAAIFGTVYLLLSSDENVTASDDSPSKNNVGIVDVKATMSPTSVPSQTPTSSPISTPTYQPSHASANDNVANKPPTGVPFTSNPTSTPTTLSPSSSPSTELYSRIIPLIKSVSRNPELFDDTTSLNYFAAEWVRSNSTVALVGDEKIIQRYVAVLLDLSLHGSFVLSVPSVDECEWSGITCNADTKFSAIISLLWNDQGMTGRIPNDIGLLSALQTLDISENVLTGFIPNGVYDCTQLQFVYLQRNQFDGTLSTWIGALSNLVHLFLGHNALTGQLPSELGGFVDEFANTKPLEWLSLFDNQFSGSLPSNLMWSNMVYLDLGKNSFSGTIPSDWVDGDSTMINLKSLYLDHNHFNGSLPENWYTLGNGTIEQIVINDNWLTGEIPSVKGGNPNEVSDIIFSNLTILEIQNNAFTRFDKNLCKQSVYSGGWLTILNADCEICECSDLCDTTQCAA